LYYFSGSQNLLTGLMLWNSNCTTNETTIENVFVKDNIFCFECCRLVEERIIDFCWQLMKQNWTRKFLQLGVRYRVLQKFEENKKK
jgi:hypothetical protein